MVERDVRRGEDRDDALERVVRTLTADPELLARFWVAVDDSCEGR